MLKFFKMLQIYNNFIKHIADIESYLVHDFNGIDTKCVDRRNYLAELSYNKRVLHFGFLDSPLLEERIAGNLLLHQELKKKAKYLFGVDIDELSLSKYRDITNDKDNTICDLQKGADISSLKNDFDLILFPEVLEHVANPGIILGNLRHLCMLNNNAKLCITVPNAFSTDGFIAAMNNIEVVHPDHYYYFSPVTLTKLLTDLGYRNINLTYYGSPIQPGLTKSGIIALCEP